MKVIIPMSGMSSRFSTAGYTIPKYLIEIDGKKVIEHIIDLYPKDSDFIFIINNKHENETDIVEVLEELVDNRIIATIPSHKKVQYFQYLLLKILLMMKNKSSSIIAISLCFGNMKNLKTL